MSTDTAHRHWPPRVLPWLAAAVATITVAVMGAVTWTEVPVATTVAATETMVVSLTFDDGYSDQLEAADIMDEHGVKGTFYVPSGLIGKQDGAGEQAPAHMTSAQLVSLQDRGHEVGGHTVTHADLTQLDADEARRQICDDRVALTDLGLRVTSFAYPYAAVNEQAEQIAEECGYNSARGLGAILSPDLPGVDDHCSDCPAAETIPPDDPYHTKAPNQVENTWTLASLQETVTRAEATGGWLQLTFHHVDNTGGSISITPELFEEFVDWLADRASRGTVVKTVDAVVGGESPAVVSGPVAEHRPETGNLLLNPGLEETGPDGVRARCWQEGGWGENSPSFSRMKDARTGNAAELINMKGYMDGDAKLLPMQDLGACAPAVRQGETYELRVWYKSSRVTQFEIYMRNESGGWSYWKSSPYFPATSKWSQATFTTPDIPADVQALSFGLNIAGDGTLATDDYAMYHSDHAPALEPRTGNLVMNPGMEEVDGTQPQCWQLAGWGTNTPSFKMESAGRTGSAARLDMSSYTDGDAKLVPTLDAGACAPPVSEGKTYDLGAWYQSTGQTQFEIYRRTKSGEWVYWASSPFFDARGTWSEASFTTPPVPAGTTHVSFGLNVAADGNLLTDDYRMQDSDQAAPGGAASGR
jgi:peptidoglycan/xylan/chitin deacetylase (PgdA/CDA1 family)